MLLNQFRVEGFRGGLGIAPSAYWRIRNSTSLLPLIGPFFNAAFQTARSAVFR
jgi:hypothetical protein